MRLGRRVTWCVVLLVLGGCGARRATVGLEGEVSFEGRAVEKGRIDFIPIEETAGPSAGAAIANGRYAVAAEKGPLRDGVYQVRIVAYRKTGKTQPNLVVRGGPPMEIQENFIPAVYSSESTLKVRVTDLSDKHAVDFHLGKSPSAAGH